MSTFTYSADYSAANQETPNVKVAQFGDGYQQRATFGINIRAQKWSLSFNLRETAEADAILAFFRSANGVSSFDWTPPGGTAGKYVCMQWNYSIEKATRKSISAEFQEVFEP